MAREVRLWEWLKEGTRDIKGLHMRRVENRVEDGGPDVDGCWNGRYFELELKGCDRPVRGGGLDFEIRRSQYLWHRRRRKANGNIWVYIRVGKGREIKRYLVSSDHIAEIFNNGVTEQRLAELTIIPPDHTPKELLQVACILFPQNLSI